MGGAGHMQDMINKIKQNTALRASKRRDKRSQKLSKSKTTKLEFKKVSPSELKKIKNKIRLSTKRERLKTNVLTLLIGLPVTIIVVYYTLLMIKKLFR